MHIIHAYVYVCILLPTCAHTYINSYMHTHMHTHIYIHYTCMHACIHVHTYIIYNVQTFTYSYNYIGLYIHPYMHSCIHTCVHVYRLFCSSSLFPFFPSFIQDLWMLKTAESHDHCHWNRSMSRRRTLQVMRSTRFTGSNVFLGWGRDTAHPSLMLQLSGNSTCRQQFVQRASPSICVCLCQTVCFYLYMCFHCLSRYLSLSSALHSVTTHCTTDPLPADRCHAMTSSVLA